MLYNYGKHEHLYSRSFFFKSSIDESYTDIFLTTYGMLYVKGGVAKKSLAYVLFALYIGS